MQIMTSRFGSVSIEADDILVFPNGLIGFEQHRHWVLLADSQNESVGWLQCLSNPQMAVPVVSPRRYVPEYQARVSQTQLEALQLADEDSLYVLCVLGKHEGEFTMNLQAPVLVNLDRCLGCQVVTIDEQPLQHALRDLPLTLRKSA
ncbi:MAG: flagellar assembly protein FliW [Pirellulaceae bacterium]|nr:flagellar assembly protein FliW [Planctomycetales bacterium]MCA9211353.1 flagellar assembly protein FliW [Planctomycetales bacterium]MCA9226412.1 flagellar assembly protein FliW [Planctomycetales bacterium]